MCPGDLVIETEWTAAPSVWAFVGDPCVEEGVDGDWVDVGLTRDDVVVMCVVLVCGCVWEEMAVVDSLGRDGGATVGDFEHVIVV